MSGKRDKPSGRVPNRRLVRQTAGLFKAHRAGVATIALLVVITSGAGVVNPVLIKVVFDTALFPHRGNVALPVNVPWLETLVGIMIGITIVTGAIGVLQTYITNRVGQRVMEELRNRLYEHLQGMSLRFFTGTRTGEIQSRLTNDVGGIQSVVTDTATSLLSNIVTLLSTLVAMLVLSWQLTVLSLAITPLFVFYTYRAGRVRRQITMQAQESKAEISAITEETLSVSGMLLAKVFGRGSEEVARFRKENHRLANLAIRQEMIGRALFAVIGAFFSSAPALVYLIAGFVLAGGHSSSITPGTIVAFTTLQSRLFFPIGSMLSVSIEIQASLALFERIFDYLKMPHDIVDRPGARGVAANDIKGDVRLKKVYFRYDRGTFGPMSEPAAPHAVAFPVPNAHSTEDGDPVPNEIRRDWALEDVSFEVKPGQLAAIVGPSGAGKTTISYLIPRLYDVSKGAVLLDGMDVRDYTIASLAGAISMVTQETYLFHASVRRNLTYAKPDATQDELEAAARAAFIHDRIVALDEGYDTLVGERGYRMSGGEKQRLAIARVVLKAPRVLILDEATSALDTTSERLVQAALEPLLTGRTTIAIAHRLSTILAADVIFVIDRGRLLEQGTHAELLRRGGAYAKVYEQQFQGGRVEAICEDGMVLASGEVVAATPAA
ncbi:MAG TPA: ABC transporter ATP-binding protein [Candidatus Saccharimonadales bacterium]|nr:ABC transporter ATP-binding protein [Candidatus Saccharimonadales bacterium]